MPVEFLEKLSSQEDTLGALEPYVQDWFTSTFPAGFTDPQLAAIPQLHARKNTLVFAPTGSGKTLAAFLAAINELYQIAQRGELEDTIYVLYISPLRALSNDIHRNLEEPLSGILLAAKEKGIELPLVRQAVRSGDTPTSERTKMARKPPHILITTPESMALILSSPKFKLNLKTLRWVIVDEIHEISSNKRGSMLSVGLEMLEELVEGKLTRIGLSATQAPIEELAKFLVGFQDNGQPRDCQIAKLDTHYTKDLEVLSPVKDLIHTPYSLIHESSYGLMSQLSEDNRTTLVFTNTRAATERTSFNLKQIMGTENVNRIAAHHGSLSREIRLDVEERLKRGELKIAVSSTSLELGIDIGDIDLVVQAGSPKSVAKFIQRAGRAGHSLDRVTKARLIADDRDDLLECAVLIRSALDGQIDRVQIPKMPLDVLAQTIVGISLIGTLKVEDVYKQIQRSYTYHNLPLKDFISVLEYLAGHDLAGDDRAFARKIWYDPEQHTFGKKRSARMIYFTNIGTIPSTSSYTAVLEGYRSPLGSLTESFVEVLLPGDVFVLGGRTYQFQRTAGSRVIVTEALGRRPTVPSWAGQMLPRSFDLSVATGNLLEELHTKLADDDITDPQILEWLRSNFRIDQWAADSILNYVNEQLRFINRLPSAKRILLETYIDQRGRQNLIFQSYFGRRANDALARSYGFKIGERLAASVSTAVNDNGFLITLPANTYFAPETIPDLLKPNELRTILPKAIKNTELYKQRFRHCAARGLMILRRIGARTISPQQQQRSAERLLNMVSEMENFCIVKETVREILEDHMDIENAEWVLKGIDNGDISFDIVPLSEIPSPFAHGIVLLGSSDVVMIEDKQALLRELHRKVLSQVVGVKETDVSSSLFTWDAINTVFDQRQLKNANLDTSSTSDLLVLVAKLQPLGIFNARPPSVFEYTNQAGVENTVLNAVDLINEGKLVMLPFADQMMRAVGSEAAPRYIAALRRGAAQDVLSREILAILETTRLSTAEIAEQLEDCKFKEVEEGLKTLHRATLILPCDYEIGKAGAVRHKWGVIGDILGTQQLEFVQHFDPDEAVNDVLLEFLRQNGPCDVHDFMGLFPLSQDDIFRSLERLEKHARVLSGNLVSGKATPQFIRKEDREIVREVMREDVDGVEFFPAPVLLEQRYRNSMLLNETDSQLTPDPDNVSQLRQSFETALKHLLHVPDATSLSARVEGTHLGIFRSLRKENAIVRGRFFKGRLGYVHVDDLPTVLSAICEDIKLEKEQTDVLELLETTGSMTRKQIAERLGCDPDELRINLDILEKNGYLIRGLDASEFTSNVRGAVLYQNPSAYLGTTTGPPRLEARKQIVNRMVLNQAPVTLFDVTAQTGFPYAEVEAIVQELAVEKKIVTKRLTVAPTEYYLTETDVTALQEIKKRYLADETSISKGRILVLPTMDPFVEGGLKALLKSRDRAISSFVILCDAHYAGSFELGRKYVKTAQVLNLEIHRDKARDPRWMTSMAKVLLDFARRGLLLVTVQIEDVAGRSLLAASNSLLVRSMERAGYRLVRDILLGGETLDHTHALETIQHFLFKKHQSALIAGFSEEAVVAAVEDNGEIAIDDLAARFVGIPAAAITSTLNEILQTGKLLATRTHLRSWEFARLLRSGLLRMKKLDELQRQITDCFKNGQILTPRNLAGRIESPIKDIHSAIRYLLSDATISAAAVGLPASDTPFRSTSISKKEALNMDNAKLEYVFHWVQQLGPVDESAIATHAAVARRMTPVGIRAQLALLVDKSRVLHGRFIQGDPRVFYITRSDYKLLGDVERLESVSTPTTWTHPPFVMLASAAYAASLLALLSTDASVSSSQRTSHVVVTDTKLAASVDECKMAKNYLKVGDLNIVGSPDDVRMHNILDSLERYARSLLQPVLLVARVNGYPIGA